MNYYYKVSDIFSNRCFKVLLIMKLIVISMIMAMLHVSAATVGQRITISSNNNSLKSVLEHIKKQAKVNFVYSNRLLDKSIPVSLNVKNQPIDQVLTEIFKNQPLDYELNDGAILIKDRPAAKTPPVRTQIVPIAQAAVQQFWIIKGQVKDLKGTAIPGVTITVKDVDQKAVTNSAGEFSVHIPTQKKTVYLDFSAVFLKAKTMQVNMDRNFALTVVMEERNDDIEEVQVTGYQTIDKRISTSEITTVMAEDILVPGMSSIDRVLEGRIPDLVFMSNSGEVGATGRIRVRGTSTLLGNREPLWVLDGFIMQDPVQVSNEDLNDPDYINIIGNAIAGINPQDIERIDILKDASATALYGTRAANGVVVVTTKKGSVGPTKIGYNHSSKITQRPRYTDYNINLMNSSERMKFGQDLSNLHYQFPTNMPLVGYEGALHRFYKGVTDFQGFSDEVRWYESVNTDWFDILTRDAYSVDHTLTASGGSGDLRYYGSLGYNPEQGVTKGTNTSRFTGRVNLNFSVMERLKASFSVYGNNQKKNHLNTQIQAMDYAYNTTRTLPIYNQGGSLYYYDKVGYNGINQPGRLFRYNILNEIDNSSNTYDGNSVGANMNLRYTIKKGIEFTLAGSYVSNSALQENWWGENSHYIARLRNGEVEDAPRTGEAGYSELPYGGIIKTSNSRSEAYTFRSQLDYRKSFGPEKYSMFTAMGGFELNGTNSKNISDENRGFVRDRGLQFIDEISLEDYPYYKT